jgi:two-component system response regulator NreC
LAIDGTAAMACPAIRSFLATFFSKRVQETAALLRSSRRWVRKLTYQLRALCVPAPEEGPNLVDLSESQVQRVVVGSAHAGQRRGLVSLLDREEGLNVSAEAADVGSLLVAVRHHRPRIVLLDTDDDVLAVVRMLTALLAAGPRVRVLLVSSDRTPGFIRQVMRAGAAGYVLREAALAELATAVRLVAMGRSYLDPQLGAELAGEADTSVNGVRLTARETEILRLVALGHTNAEIAEMLFLSVRTIDSHRAHVQSKLGCRNRAGLVREALARGLLEA